MWDMDHVAVQAADNRVEFQVALKVVVASSQGHGVKVRRQHTALRHFYGRANEVVIALAVQTSQRADHVANIGANSEFRHSTDVDGYFHEWNLTTERTKRHNEFMRANNLSFPFP